MSKKRETPKDAGSGFFKSLRSQASDLPSSVVWTLTLLFLALTAFNMFHHEMWRDELEAWMLARDSTSIPDLIHNMRYSGNPMLWYIPLFAISRFTRDPMYMQMLHALIATSAAYVVLRYAIFPRLHKVLFVFGFFPFYQYAVVSRSYALGVLLVFIYCALFAEREKRLIPLSITVFLLANTSAYDWMMALPLGLALVADRLFRDPTRELPSPSRKTVVLSAIIILLGLGVAALQMAPLPDSGFIVDWEFSFTRKHLKSALGGIVIAYMPRVDELLDVQGVIGHFDWRKLLLLPFPFFALALARKPAACLVYVVSGTFFLVFQFVKYPGYVWHDGHYFIALIASVWLSQHCAEKRYQSSLDEKFTKGCQRLLWPALLLLLMLHVAKSAEAMWNGYVWPYSSAKATAEFITQNKLGGLLLVGDVDYAASPVGAFLDKPMYYPRSRRWGTYTIWNQERLKLEPKGWRPIGETELCHQSMQLASREQKDVLLVLNYPLKNTMWRRSGAEMLYVSEPAMIDSERFFVYRVPYHKLIPATSENQTINRE